MQNILQNKNGCLDWRETLALQTCAPFNHIVSQLDDKTASAATELRFRSKRQPAIRAFGQERELSADIICQMANTRWTWANALM